MRSRAGERSDDEPPHQRDRPPPAQGPHRARARDRALRRADRTPREPGIRGARPAQLAERRGLCPARGDGPLLTPASGIATRCPTRLTVRAGRP